MKKIISVVLCLAMVLSLFAGCGANKDLVNARDYLVNMYQKGDKDKPMKMLMDTDVLANVTVDGKSYTVDWSVTVTSGASDAVKISESTKANHVKIDVPETPEADILFTATATVKDEKGNTEAATFKYEVKGMGSANRLTAAEIIAQAYALSDGTKMEGTHSLTGKVTSIVTPYDAAAKVVTVIIAVDEHADKPFKCVRLTGTGADTIAVNDYITVSGTIAKFEGVVEFSAGCTVTEIVKDVPAPEGAQTDAAKIFADAKALAHQGELSYTSVLTGKVISIGEAYSEEFDNITVTIAVPGYEDTPVQCYRMKGTNIAKIEKNDTITVSGTIMKYSSSIQFKSGATMTKRISGGGAGALPTDEKAIVDAAFALSKGESLDGDPTLTGKVKYIKTPYDASHKNITVAIEVEGTSGKKELLCYRMKGDGVDKIVGGDTITVKGSIKNYNGTIEFDQDCVMLSRVSGGVTVPTDKKAIVDAAFSLPAGEFLPYIATLTGKITSIKTPYDNGFGNITVYIEVEGTSGTKQITCYRMKGGSDLQVGDVITVTGSIKNHKHSSGDTEVEFDAGATYTK